MRKRSATRSEIPLLDVIEGAVRSPPPVWFMRQAGRYLPEYAELRAKAGGFLELCLTPSFAVEATLQPLRRFGLDAAILFSDILIIPYALGVRVWFEEGEGPRLEGVPSRVAFARMREALDFGIVERVYEAVAQARARLPEGVALIGFCGGPWTVATYLVAGRGTEDQGPAKELMERDESLFGSIVNRLVEASAQHLIGQLRAGVDVVQIFDTWAGALDSQAFERWCMEPTARIVEKVRAEVPDARVIVFPRGARLADIERLIDACRPDAVSLDSRADRRRAREALATRCALQGNLDPLTLVQGGVALDRAVDEILEDFRGVRHIFNLGHGIRPETPVAHVERVIARVRRGA